jgi:hypothetical protein
MGDLGEIVATAATVAVADAAILLLFAGVLRIPWRHALIVAFGMALVLFVSFVASRGNLSGDAIGNLTILAAIGGGIAVRGYDRGMRQRDEMIASIVGRR